MTAVADQSPDLLQEFALALIGPMLAAGGIGDPALARRAAIDTIAAYRAAGRDQLVSVMQLIGFAMVSLDSLRLSLPAELSLAMKLKLRGNANALNRSAQRNTATLEQQRRDADSPPPEDDSVATAAALASLEQARVMVTAPEIPAPVVPAPAKTEPQGSDDQERRRLWANAMTDVAAECSRNLNKLPPAQRRAEIIRIGALSATVQQLMLENRLGAARSGQHALQK